MLLSSKSCLTCDGGRGSKRLHLRRRTLRCWAWVWTGTGTETGWQKGHIQRLITVFRAALPGPAICPKWEEGGTLLGGATCDDGLGGHDAGQQGEGEHGPVDGGGDAGVVQRTKAGGVLGQVGRLAQVDEQ